VELLDCKGLEARLRSTSDAEAIRVELSDLAITAAALSNVLFLAPGQRVVAGSPAHLRLLLRLAKLDRRLAELADRERAAA
jgi:hypothetical protein